MKFLKLIQSETEIDKSLEYDVLYYNNTSAKITVKETNPITSTTYEVKNVSNPTSLPYNATSMVVSFTGVKTETYKKGQVEVTETSETETVSFEANASSAETVTRSGSFEWNEQSVAWEVELKGKEDPYEQYLVDLGLPSGLKWMSMNIGSNEIDDHGLYFQWGATEGYKYSDKNHSSWTTAPFNNGSSSYDETYFASVKDTVCPNGVLAAEYDAATKAYGEGYRMPTKEDFEELIANTTSAWTRVGSYYTSCVKLTSKNDTSKSIIFTANGRMNNGEREYLSTYGYYWTRNFSIDYPYVGYCLSSSSARVFVYNNLGRCMGAGIRAVHE